MAEDLSSRSRRHQEPATDPAEGDGTAPKKKRKRQRKAEELRHALEQMSAEDRLKFAREAAVTGHSSKDVGFSERKVGIALSLAAVRVAPCVAPSAISSNARSADACSTD